MLKRYFLAGIAGLAITASAVTTVQAKSLDDILSDGVIRIGINPNFPNMSTRNDSGEWEGFDIEVGNALAASIGEKRNAPFDHCPGQWHAAARSADCAMRYQSSRFDAKTPRPV